MRTLVVIDKLEKKTSGFEANAHVDEVEKKKENKNWDDSSLQKEENGKKIKDDPRK